MSFDGRGPLIEDELRWKMTIDEIKNIHWEDGL